MLLQITINNFALIDKISLSFFEGFNVLSGETGAGKSILIDAINYVMGSKFNKDLIRTGEERTYVEAVFSIDSSKTKEIMKEMGIAEDNMVILSRETFHNGRSISKINGKSTILSQLKEVSRTLLDIHGQHENQSLLEPLKHISYLDSFSSDSISRDLEKYKKLFQEYTDINNKIKELSGSKDMQNVINFLKYQIDDIESAKLSAEEEEDLKEEYKTLSNAEKINISLNNAYGYLKEYGESQSASDLISLALRELTSVEKHFMKVSAINRNLESISFALGDITDNIRDLKDNLVYDEDRLEKINNRLYEIASFKSKYSRSVKDIILYKQELEQQFENLTNSEAIIKEFQDRKMLVEKELNELAKSIHNIRQDNSLKLEAKVMKEFKQIGMEKSTFKVQVTFEDNLLANGRDRVQFLISTNPGEPLKPLEKVVSGGELSRIMLALKIVFMDKDEIPSIIFDEVDTGISGRIAQSVAEKMYLIATKYQVLCVTHLPQIAAMSDHNFLVSKNSIEHKTFTKIDCLKREDKEKEIARMIGGVEITKVTLENAKEMISLADAKKKLLNS